MSVKDLVQNSKSTQDFVPIKEIKNGVAILKDGGLRSIVMVSSINFGLKSADEKMAIISAFLNFLNAIDFSIQIFIQSRRLNINPYLRTLEERMAVQTNELLKVQIKEYIEFIKFFTENHNVMTKSFFIVVAYDPAIIQASSQSGWISRILGKSDKKRVDVGLFEENLEQLNQRINVVRGGLNRIGLRSEVLGTEELIELYFKLFNPGETEIPNAPDKNPNPNA